MDQKQERKGEERGETTVGGSAMIVGG